MNKPTVSAYWLLITSLFITANVHARVENGVTVPDNVQVNGKTLLLNGAGTRTKFVFDIYVGALYLANPTNSAKQVIASPDSKQVSMYFLYDKISPEKMAGGWIDGFEDALDEAALKQMQPQIKTFTEAFGETLKGDIIHVRYTPQKGTQLIINDKTAATIPGADFHQAIMKIWLGDSPVDDDLKSGMLNRRGDE